MKLFCIYTILRIEQNAKRKTSFFILIYCKNDNCEHSIFALKNNNFQRIQTYINEETTIFSSTHKLIKIYLIHKKHYNILNIKIAF